MQNHQALIDGFLSGMLKSAGDHQRGGLKENVSLMPHQENAIQKAVTSDGNIIFAHKVGTGKTLTSIATFEKLREQGKANRALVVVPAALRENFVTNGVRKFTDSKAVILGNKQEERMPGYTSVDHPPKADYYTVSYDMFRKNPEKYIKNTGADTVIYDELHKIKNDNSISYEAIKNARPLHRNFIGLTGSVVSNNPSDIVPLLDAMTYGDHPFGSKGDFKRKYVGADKHGNEFIKHPQQLRQRLSPYIDFVNETSNGSPMPRKIVSEEYVEMSPHQHQLYKHVMGKLDPELVKKIRSGATNLKKKEISDIFSQIIHARQVSNSIHTMDTNYDLSRSARETPKVKKLLDDVEEHLKETPDGQAVVHSQLINGGVDVLTQGLKDRGLEPSVFVGKGQQGVTETTRQQGVQDYLSGKKKVIVISGAGSEGLNLNNTTMVASLDGHFNPERILQAEARGVRADSLLHRPPEQRQILAKRYITSIPEETARGFVGSIKKFFGLDKKPVSTDEWINNLSRKKHELNTQFKDVFGKAAEAGHATSPDTTMTTEEMIKIAADYCYELSDLIEKAEMGKQADVLDIPDTIPDNTAKLIRSFSAKYNIHPKIYADAKSDADSYYIPGTPSNRENPKHYQDEELTKRRRPGVHVSQNNPNPAVVLHELAHAYAVGDSTSIAKATGLLSSLIGLGMAASTPFTPKLGKLAPLVVAAGYIPQLYSEGAASVRAAKHLMEEQGNKEGLKNSVKALTPGLLSYLAIPAVVAGTAIGSHQLLSKAFREAGAARKILRIT